MKDYTTNRTNAEKALTAEGLALDDYDETVFGISTDGIRWYLCEDSLSLEEAEAWAKRAHALGDLGARIYHWSPA